MEYNLKTDAKFSVCRKYRYALWRNWDDSKPFAMIIGLNPSTADENENDRVTFSEVLANSVCKGTKVVSGKQSSNMIVTAYWPL